MPDHHHPIIRRAPGKSKSPDIVDRILHKLISQEVLWYVGVVNGMARVHGMGLGLCIMALTLCVGRACNGVEDGLRCAAGAAGEG